MQIQNFYPETKKTICKKQMVLNQKQNKLFSLFFYEHIGIIFFAIFGVDGNADANVCIIAI